MENLKYYVAWDDNSNTLYVPIEGKSKPAKDHFTALEFSDIEEAKSYGEDNVNWPFWVEDSEGEVY